jgi:hypothetical protein
MKLMLGTMMVVAFAVAIGCEGNISTAPESADVGAGGASPPPDPAPPGDPKQAAQGAKAEPAEATSPQAPEAATPEAATPEAATPEAATPEAATPEAGTPEPAAKPAASDGGSTEVATARSGAKGRDYGGPGFITTPIQQYFRAEAQINLLHMANAMKIYKAGHDNKGPKTQEEFMNVIVKENGIQLPELPTGDEYFYDPKTAELMVKHPAK